MRDIHLDGYNNNNNNVPPPVPRQNFRSGSPLQRFTSRSFSAGLPDGPSHVGSCSHHEQVGCKPQPCPGDPPPPVDMSERALPCPWRSTLCQVRSEFCRSLNSYTAVLNNGDPTCPECGSGPQTTGHLFNCTANPLACKVVDLWCNPLHAAPPISVSPFFFQPSSFCPCPVLSLAPPSLS